MQIWNRAYEVLQQAGTNRWIATVVVALALCGFACGNDLPVEPVFEDLPPSPGTGSGTLLVIVDVEGRETDDAGLETEFAATVTGPTGAPVSGSVVVSGRFGTVQLEEGVAGSYSAIIPGYETGSYTLNVVSGSDVVTGVTTPAPDLHSITSPRAQQVVPANTALNVRWSRDIQAQETRLTTRDYDSDWIYGDPGTLYTPTVGNPPRSDQRIEVMRRNFQRPDGALPGSIFSVSFKRAIAPVVSM